MEDILNTVIAYEQDLPPLTVAFRVILAAFFGAVIGIERGRHGSQAGMRTHIFVALGGALTSLLGAYCVRILGFDGDPLRVAAQVVSGIGFLGAGMIIVKSEKMITGLTTAAIMWTTAIIGIATGLGFYVGSLIAVLVCAFTASVLNRIERKRKTTLSMYIEVDDLSAVSDISDRLKNILPEESSFEIVPAKSGTVGSLGIKLISSELDDLDAFKSEVSALPGVKFLIIE